MWDILGLGLKNQAQGEISNLSDDRTELESWDLGDRFRSAITGVSREETQKKAQELLDKKINATTSVIRNDITTLGGGLNLGHDNLKIQAGETVEDHNARLAGYKTVAELAGQYSTMENADIGLLKPGMSVGQLRALSGDLSDSNKRKAEDKQTAEIRRQETRQDTIRADATTEATRIRSDDRAYQQDQLNFQRRENNLNRTQERELADSSSNLQMQMAIMNNDLAEKRMDYDRETARMDKRDRMIATLMSGLGQLGSAFG